MPRIEEDPPDAVVIDRDGVEFRVGKDGALSFNEVAALRHQHEKRAEFVDRELTWPISSAHLEALLAVKRAMPGAVVEDWADPKARQALNLGPRENRSQGAT